MKKISAVRELQNLCERDYVGYYHADKKNAVTELSIVSVHHGAGHIILKSIDTLEALKLPDRIELVSNSGDVRIDMTPEKWSKLGLKGNYPGSHQRKDDPEEIIFLLNQREEDKHAIMPQL